MNAVIYARYSSDRQREESIEGQLRECTDYHIPGNILFTLFDCVDQSFVDHHGHSSFGS